MKKHMYFIIVIVIGIVLCILFARYLYQGYSSKQIYHGCIVVKKTRDKPGKYLVVNPNNVSESVVLDFENIQMKLGKEVFKLIFDDSSLYLLTRDLKRKTPYTIIKIMNGTMSTLPIELPYSNRHDNRLLSLKDSLVIADDEKVFFVSKKNYKINTVYTARKEYTNILPYHYGAITVSKNNEVVYLHEDKQEILFCMPKNWTFHGWFQIEENFLIYDKEEQQSLSVNLAGDKIEVLGTQPYDVLGNQDKNVVLLRMLPQGGGGVTMLDFEYDWIDLIRAEGKRCLMPYIYDIRTKNIINLKFEIVANDNIWQKMDFNKEYLEKLAKSLDEM